MADDGAGGGGKSSSKTSVNHTALDYEGLPKSNFEDIIPWWLYMLKTAGSMYILFNGIITLMGLSWGFLKTVNDVEDYILWIAVYGPLGFFVVYFLIFNNYYSQIAYFEALSKSAMLDYPRSSLPGYWGSSANAVFFLLMIVIYLGFMMWVFADNGAEFNVYFVFISNLAIQIILFWYGQQGIEDRMITLFVYITAYEDVDGKRDGPNGIDKANLQSAMDDLNQMALVEVSTASYGHYMASWYWRTVQKYSEGVMMIFRFLWLFSVVGIAFLAWSMFVQDLDRADGIAWREQVNPCLNVCEYNANMTACECIDECKDASNNNDNGACSSAAPEYFQNFTECC